MQPVVKGMIQVVATTHRIVRVALGQYDVIRILDDAQVGGTVVSAKTSWVGCLALG